MREDRVKAFAPRCREDLGRFSFEWPVCGLSRNVAFPRGWRVAQRIGCRRLPSRSSASCQPDPPRRTRLAPWRLGLPARAQRLPADPSKPAGPEPIQAASRRRCASDACNHPLPPGARRWQTGWASFRRSCWCSLHGEPSSALPRSPRCLWHFGVSGRDPPLDRPPWWPCRASDEARKSLDSAPQAPSESSAAVPCGPWPDCRGAGGVNHLQPRFQRERAQAPAPFRRTGPGHAGSHQDP